MNKKKIFILTDPELGWNCIVGCYATIEICQLTLKQMYDESDYTNEKTFEEYCRFYIIHEKELYE